LGNQRHAGEGLRQIREWIQAGVIGTVREVHGWTDRPVNWWKQPEPSAPLPLSIAEKSTAVPPLNVGAAPCQTARSELAEAEGGRWAVRV